MADHFLASGGGEGSGEGKWAFDVGHLCELTVMNNGLLQSLSQLLSLQFGRWKTGLFQNDREPRQTDSLSNYVPCDWSGYQGLQRIYFLNPPFMAGKRARAEGQELVWSHDGGPIANFVYGFYVVDNNGDLAYAERFCKGPFEVKNKGRKFKLTPVFTARNEERI